METQDEETPVYEKQAQEGNKAYLAFCCYRDMGRCRSLLKAYRLHTGIKQAAHVSGVWGLWAEKYNWTTRVIAYDAHLEFMSRKETEAAYREELEKHRERVKQLAQAAMKLTIKMLEKCITRMNSLEAQDLTPSQLFMMLRTASAVGETAINAEAQVLGVEEILKELMSSGETAA